MKGKEGRGRQKEERRIEMGKRKGGEIERQGVERGERTLSPQLKCTL